MHLNVCMQFFKTFENLKPKIYEHKLILPCFVKYISNKEELILLC